MKEIRFKFVLETVKELKPHFYACMMLGKNVFFYPKTKLKDCKGNIFSVYYVAKYKNPSIKYTGIVVIGNTKPEGDYFVIQK